MNARSTVSAAVALFGTVAFSAWTGACTNGGGGTGTTPQESAQSYEPPTSPYQPASGYQPPASPYQPGSGLPGASSGAVGSGGSCSYCGQTYRCTAIEGTFSDTSSITLPPATGDECIESDDAGSGAFSCSGTILYNGASTPWTATSGGGFSYSVSDTSTTSGTNGSGTTTTTITVTCVPASSSSPGSSSGFGDDAG